MADAGSAGCSSVHDLPGSSGLEDHSHSPSQYAVILFYSHIRIIVGNLYIAYGFWQFNQMNMWSCFSFIVAHILGSVYVKLTREPYFIFCLDSIFVPIYVYFLSRGF